MNQTIILSYYTSINENYKQTDEEKRICRWDISVLKDCEGSTYFL